MTVFQDYYVNGKTKDLLFDIYGYSPPSDGKWTLDGEIQDVGEDFRTVDRYKEYSEAGFNILLTQTTATYNGEDFVNSKAKMVMDNAYAAGIKKIIVLDDRIYWLSREPDGVVGEGKRFSSYEELDKFILDCIEPYKNHPAFYGVQIVDEPSCVLFESISQIFKSIKRVRPNTFVHCNLFPLCVLTSSNGVYPSGGDLYERFKDYICDFIEKTGADYVMYDNYPITVSNPIYRMYIRALQITAQACKEKSARFYYVVQSFGMKINGEITHPLPTKSEMYYQINMILGFGIKEFSYFTYWTKASNNSKGELFPDGEAMMTRNGKKTEMYYIVKEINEWVQKLAPVILNFNYISDRYFIKTPFKTHPIHLEYTGRGKLKNIKNAITDEEVVLINELYDKNRKKYMYRIQNVTYPFYKKNLDNAFQTTKVIFVDKYNFLDVFEKGEWRTEKLVNHEYTVKLEPGYAQFVLPY